MNGCLVCPAVLRWLILGCSSLLLGVCAPAFANPLQSDEPPNPKQFPLTTAFPLDSANSQEVPRKAFASEEAASAIALEIPPTTPTTVDDLSIASPIVAPIQVSPLPPATIAQQSESNEPSDFERWSLEVEALFLDRDLPDVVTTEDIATNDDYGTDNLSFDIDTGIRWTVGYQFSPADSLEFGGFGLINHQDSDTFTSSVTSPGGEVLRAAFNPEITDSAASNFAQAYQQSINYSSELTNLELNYRHTLPRSSDGWQGSLLVGLRYLDLNEDFRMRSIDEDPDIFPDTPTGRYDIDTDNDAIGLQMGGNLSYQFSNDLNVGLRLRTGLLLNSANQDSEIRNDLGGQIVTTNGDNSDTEISPVLELGAFLNWALSQNVILSAGYNFMLFGNMVLAPNQFATSSDFSDSLSELERGTVVYHGPSLGLQVRF